MNKRWKLRVNRRACIGAGACAAASGRFELDDDYRSYAVEEVISPQDEVMAAARGCPVDAISITDADTGEAIYP